MTIRIYIFLSLLLLNISHAQTPPAWWTQGNPPVINANSANNKGPANIGQAKHMAKSALDALRPLLPDVTTLIEADLAALVDFTIPPDPKPAEWLAKQKAPLLIGQLKAIAKPFYDRLHAVSPTWLAGQLTLNATQKPSSIYPWTTDPADDANKSIATIGQLKAVFSLRFENFNPDSDADGLDDAWEIANFTNLTSQSGSDDPDTDGITNQDEWLAGTNPNSPLTPGNENISVVDETALASAINGWQEVVSFVLHTKI